MKILFISRVRYGTMGSGALNWFPFYVAQAGHDVKVIECLNDNGDEEVIHDPMFNLDVFRVQSENLFEHLDMIFEVSRKFIPNVIYLFGRSNLYDFVYHLKHRFPKSNIIVDIRSPLLSLDSIERDRVEKNFNKLQYYVQQIHTADSEAIKTYTQNLFKPVVVVPIGVHCCGIKFRESKAYNNIRRFVFVGSIYNKRRIDLLVDNFISFANSVKDDVSLDIYGTGNAVTKISSIINNRSANNVVKMMGTIPQADLFKILCEYDAGIAYVPYELYSAAPSLKSLEYAASGIPVLASDTLAHKRYCSEHGFRFGLFNNDKKSFVKYFKSVYENGFNRDDVLTNIQVVKKFDWKNIVDDLLIPQLQKFSRI